MIKECVDCMKPFEATRKDTQRCSVCKKKRRSMQVMLSRKKYNPDIEIGVGSGRSKINQAGPEHHSWKTGITGYRKLVTKEHCTKCGSTRYLLVHHLNGDRHDNTQSNLQVLCKRCHQILHVKRDTLTGRFLAK